MTDNTTSRPRRRFSRRSILLGTGGIVLGSGAVAAGTTVLADEESNGTDEGSTGSDETGMTFRTGAFVWDTDMNMQFENAVEPAEDPVGEDRDGVVHATSHDEETSDYAVAAIDLRGESITLDGISDPGSFTYDYYAGSTTTNRVPDEVYFFLRTGDGFAVAVRSEDAEGSDAWETRDVSSELTADGWRTIELGDADIDVDGERVHASTERIGQHVAALQQQDAVTDLTSQFGTDATVLGMALGAGTLNGAVVDAYYDNVQIHDEAYRVPAVLPMEASFDRPQGRGGGRITASLSFHDDDHGLSAEDIDAESVRLAPYSPVAPPLPGSGDSERVALADDVSASADGVEVEFVPGHVQRLVEGNRPTSVLVFGGFDVSEPYTFVAVGELEGAGRGN